jgi:hypothetical protein
MPWRFEHQDHQRRQLLCRLCSLGLIERRASLGYTLAGSLRRSSLTPSVVTGFPPMVH